MNTYKIEFENMNVVVDADCREEAVELAIESLEKTGVMHSAIVSISRV